MPEVIARGAEAVLRKEKKEGRDVVVKDRISKGYRLREIDDRLRKERTRGEARLLRAAMRASVAVPRVFEEKQFELIEEFIEGRRLKEFINETDDRQRTLIAGMLGDAVAKLHSAGIVHGDLTTSNMIMSRPTESHDSVTKGMKGKHDISPGEGNDGQNDGIYLIDFGLGFFSEKPEDFGTDLAVLHEALSSTHFRFIGRIWEEFVVSYKKSFAGAGQALKALESIERRGRYVRRTSQDSGTGT